MKTQTFQRGKTASAARRSRSRLQRVVRCIVKDWRGIAKKKESFAKSAYKQGRDMAAFRAMGIASAFRYCAMRVEYDMMPNAALCDGTVENLKR